MNKHRFVIYPPYVRGKEVQRLKNRFKERGLHAFVAKRDGVYMPSLGDVIIGWGYSRPPNWKGQAERIGCLWLNHHSLILNSAKKLNSFWLFDKAGVPFPEITKLKARI